MATIDDLGVSISQMGQEQYLSHIHTIRANRRLSKKKIKAKKTPVRSIDKMIAGLTSEQRKQLIGALE